MCIRNLLLPRIWLLLGLSLSLVACTEQQPNQQPRPAANGDDDDDSDPPRGDDDDDVTPDDDDDDDSSSNQRDFGLCKDGLKKEEKLEDNFRKFVESLCEDDKLSILRQDKYVYSGGSKAKILTGEEDTSGDETSLRMFTSSLVDDIKPQDYFSMLKLQFMKPKEFKDNYEVNPDVEYTIDSSGKDKVSYEYKNSTDEAAIVRYEATTRFYTLENRVAYVVATVLDKSVETMLDLKGLIIINEHGSKTEIFTMSDQKYDNGGDPDATRDNAVAALEEEQKRSFKNAENADKAEDLL